jgi:16S rRNA (cytidine1402-2'-O)-methyltransferase
LVLYESGQRLADTLLALSAGLGQRDAAIVREITKLHEECVTGRLGELATRYADDIPRGEIVIVVGPPIEAEAVSDDVIDAMLDKALRRLSPSRAAAEVAEQLNIPRKRAYARALDRAR